VGVSAVSRRLLQAAFTPRRARGARAAPPSPFRATAHSPARAPAGRRAGPMPPRRKRSEGAPGQVRRVSGTAPRRAHEARADPRAALDSKRSTLSQPPDEASLCRAVKRLATSDPGLGDRPPVAGRRTRAAAAAAEGAAVAAVAAPPPPPPEAATPPPPPPTAAYDAAYEDANTLLRTLHFERAARREEKGG